jgi:hypothetical protein
MQPDSVSFQRIRKNTLPAEAEGQQKASLRHSLRMPVTTMNTPKYFSASASGTGRERASSQAHTCRFDARFLLAAADAIGGASLPA